MPPPQETIELIRQTTNLVINAFSNRTFIDSNREATKATTIKKIKNYVNNNLDDSELSAEKLLKTFNIPKHTFYRLFEHTGGLTTYIYARRLRAAIEDITQHPDLALKDIAYGVGFNSASAFSRAFKRTYGMTPQELRDCVKQISSNNRFDNS